ncbi:MAG: rRNA adenine dimethyltransferase family protein [Patescibacteria group bacterium]
MTEIIAKKQFGQNFLVDKKAQDKVVTRMHELVSQYPDRFLLEIGPGQGDLTKYILNFSRRLLAIEIDYRAIGLLESKFQDHTNFELIQADALKVLASEDITSSRLNSSFILLASLPYNLGSRILVQLAIAVPDTPFAVILQREVVLKAVKKHSFTFFGAWLNLFWDLEHKFDIHPHSFSPQPKVTSGLMTGIPKKTNKLEFYLTSSKKRTKVKNVLKAIFANPSKTLANNLKNLDWTKNQIDLFFEECSLDHKTRLSWDNYIDILSYICAREVKN